MKKILTYLLAYLAVTMAWGQEQCVELSSPVYMGFEQGHKPKVQLSTLDEVTLPIVFHVMHVGESVGSGDNITDDAILEALDYVNEQFRMVPGSTGDGIGVDTKIDFCIANRMPDGSPSLGITRHNMSSYPAFVADGISLSLSDDGMPDTQVKNIACWDWDEYVNVYIVPEINGNNGGGGIQGYAYVGPTNDCRDGVVILANRVVITEYNLGKVLTHELGHYLGLWHTFQNTYNCNPETNCQSQGDRVCDTPPTTTNYSCSSPECDGAMVENYMDYTGEYCRDSFTLGQAEKMHQTIQGGRTGLLTSVGCQPSVSYDLGVTYLQYQSPFCRLEQDVTVGISSNGTMDVPMATVAITVGGEVYTEDIYDIASNTSIEVVVPNVPLEGTFLVGVYSEYDMYEFNDSELGYAAYEPGTLWEMDFTSDFFAAETGWALYDDGGMLIAQDGSWPSGITTREYEECLYSECYTLSIYDISGDGIPYGGEVEMWIDGNYLSVDVSGAWSQLDFDFCIDDGEPCVGDFDNDGVVGNSDLLDMLVGYNCNSQCQYDLDGDDDVDVDDILVFLTLWGTYCSSGIAQPQTKSMEVGKLPDSIYGYYDVTGRRVFNLGDDLPQGIYIRVDESGAKKIFFN